MTERRSLLSAVALGLAAAAGPALAQSGAQPRPLACRVALVTGSARGIGRAAAVELARRGADVALLDIAQPEAIPSVQGYRLASRADLDEAAGLVRAEGVRALALVADVRDREAMRAAAGRAVAELGGLDILVSNAGIGGGGKASELEPERWRDLLDVNVTGFVHAVQAALPGLRRRPGGRVIVVTSVAARSGSPDSGGYAATKWAATGLMKSFAAELGPEGIAVNAVAPTAVDTVLFRGLGGGDDAARAPGRAGAGAARAARRRAGPGGDRARDRLPGRTGRALRVRHDARRERRALGGTHGLTPAAFPNGPGYGMERAGPTLARAI